jgi:hypothetical protein
MRNVRMLPFNSLTLKLSVRKTVAELYAEGMTALYLVVPISLALIIIACAIAWRIAS